jgi:citron Rho-interacting kinase
MSENLAISARTTRLNSLILGRPEALKNPQKEICAGINRDGLLDALFVLYDECSKDAVKKKSKHIQNFRISNSRSTNCSGNQAVTS